MLLSREATHFVPICREDLPDDPKFPRIHNRISGSATADASHREAEEEEVSFQQGKRRHGPGGALRFDQFISLVKKKGLEKAKEKAKKFRKFRFVQSKVIPFHRLTQLVNKPNKNRAQNPSIDEFYVVRIA